MRPPPRSWRTGSAEEEPSFRSVHQRLGKFSKMERQQRYCGRQKMQVQTREREGKNLLQIPGRDYVDEDVACDVSKQHQPEQLRQTECERPRPEKRSTDEQ